MSDDAEGGRIFFSNIRRSLELEDEIRLVSVGIDIGSPPPPPGLSPLRALRRAVRSETT